MTKQTIKFEDWEFPIDELGETIQMNLDLAQAHFYELEEQGKTLEDDCEWCIELGERIGDELFPEKADDFEKRTIIKALDNNDKEAWNTNEQSLIKKGFDKQIVKEYLDGLHQVATSENDYQSFDDFVDELKPEGTERIAECQLLITNENHDPEYNPGAKTEVWNCGYEINYDDEEIYAFTERPGMYPPNAQEGRDYSDFQIDNTEFWEFLEYLNDHDEEGQIECLIDDLNGMMSKGFEAERIKDNSENVYVNYELESLFNLIEKTIQEEKGFRKLGMVLDIPEYDETFLDVDTLPVLTDATIIQDTDDLEVMFSQISKYDVTIRKVWQRNNRTEAVTVTTLDDEKPYILIKTEEYAIFLREKII